MESPYTEVGGFRVGCWNASFPFATLSVSHDQIILTTVSILLGTKVYSIQKDQIRAITKYRGLFSSGINLSVYDVATPAPLVFWTFRFSHLRKVLEEHGYTIS